MHVINWESKVLLLPRFSFLFPSLIQDEGNSRRIPRFEISISRQVGMTLLGRGERNRLLLLSLNGQFSSRQASIALPPFSPLPSFLPLFKGNVVSS